MYGITGHFFYFSIAHNASSWNDLVISEMTLKLIVEESNRAITSTADGLGKKLSRFRALVWSRFSLQLIYTRMYTKKMEERN